jgi:hypothetical protein
MPVTLAARVLPALFHCQVVVGVCPLKYSSITIRPLTKMSNDLELFWTMNSFKAGILASFQPRLAGVFVSQALPLTGGKYMVSGVGAGVLLLLQDTNKTITNRDVKDFIERF